jgi:membrane protein implicated in regulation of membrane protease activity
MIFQRILFKITILPLMIFGLISCNSLTVAIPVLNNPHNPHTTSQIEQQKPNTEISLIGKVINVAPFLRGGAYQLEDNTGSIWVITEEDLPTKGEQIKIKGIIKQENIVIETQDFSEYYLFELPLNSFFNN